MPELELGPVPGVARAMAAVTGEPLSPPHSPERRGSNNNNSRGVTNNNNISDNNTDKPMDLSSGGGLGLTQLFRDAELPSMAPDHPLLTARRLADLVRAQHQQSEQRERESKRKWEDTEETETLTTESRPPEALRPLRASPGPGVSAAESGPGSPAGSSSGSESGQSAGPAREEKRRRLDMLLNKKFDNKVVSGLDNPILMSTPPPSERETSPASDRRPSTESTGAASASAQPLLAGERRNRRKQSQPGSRPGTPPCISIRPHSDLFPPQPAATSTPRGHKTQEARDYSPARKMSRSQSPPKSPVATKLFNDEKENKDALRNQLLQVSCFQALNKSSSRHSY